ncbi:MAG: transporter substrate-binding domain-containing protein [Burkholderiales bacterium]|nr:transporter substrate-binding domain-containing protein [Burkholderiales bacterium]
MTHLTRFLRFLALMALAGGWLCASMAAQAVGINCGDKPIRLAFYEYGNLYYQDKQQALGIDKDVADELMQRSGCRFDVQEMARARIWADLASGDLDMSVSGIENPERNKFAWFAHYLRMKNYAVVRTDIARQVQTAASFLQQPRLQFGAVRAFKHGVEQDQWLDALRAAQRVQDSANAQTLFKKLKEGRIDALFSQPPVYRKYLQDLGLQGQVVVQDWTPSEKGVAHGLILAKSRFSEADARQWQALVTGLRTDGTLKRIYNRYLPADEAAALLDF